MLELLYMMSRPSAKKMMLSKEVLAALNETELFIARSDMPPYKLSVNAHTNMVHLHNNYFPDVKSYFGNAKNARLHAYRTQNVFHKFDKRLSDGLMRPLLPTVDYDEVITRATTHVSLMDEIAEWRSKSLTDSFQDLL